MEALLPVERWVVCFAGFLQTEGQANGIERIQDAIHRRCSCESTRVLLKSWKDSPSELAERIWNRRPVDHSPRVVLIGYSYGGYTAVLLARELESRGIPVETMILIDAVWRPWERFPSVSSLARRWKIKIPRTVGAVYAWKQSMNHPQGHDIECEGPTTHMPVPETIQVEHAYMDDQPDIYMKALSVACPEKK